MNWIDVNDDLPPSNTVVLVSCSLNRKNEVVIISDAYFDPGRGWFTNGYDDLIPQVYHWHPLSTPPLRVETEEESIQRSLEGFRAVCEKLDESQ